jgi:hypothetical protein
MEAIYSYEALVPTYQTISYNKPKDRDMENTLFSSDSGTCSYFEIFRQNDHFRENIFYNTEGRIFLH